MCKVGKQTFRTVFNQKFNIGFHMPKKEHYEICNEFQNGTPRQIT